VDAAHRPFLDPTLVHGPLYARADRLAQRSGALRRAKIAGQPVAELAAQLAAATLPGGSDRLVVDIGCGRGTTTGVLAERLAPAGVVAVDRSPELLAAARTRLRKHATHVRFICADFHRLPLGGASCQAVVAAFCLYHSPRPTDVLTELARCLAPGGVAVLVTKSADSYTTLDELVARSGLDPDATTRPSLYAAAHSANLPALAATVLDVNRVIHEQHCFRFADLGHVAEYLATSPKYTLPAPLRGNHLALAAALRARLPDRPVPATSTVTYVVATRPPQPAAGRRP